MAEDEAAVKNEDLRSGTFSVKALSGGADPWIA
jgi:hypothetical protein